MADLKTRGKDLVERMNNGDLAAHLEFRIINTPVLNDPGLADALKRSLNEDQNILLAQSERVNQIREELKRIAEKNTSGQKLSREEKDFLKSTKEELKRLTRSL